MGNLADYIEAYLKRLLERAEEGIIELQRRELAEMFRCVPSQINYVLTTRFTPDRGYVVETRRGGGGYIRIVRLSFRPSQDRASLIEEEIGDEITERRADAILVRLEDEGLLDEGERAFVKAVLERETARLHPSYRGTVRASLLKAMVMLLLKE
ncbi:MAG: CtsR family transcriptional regulator [Firmicutes bacterium]|nr:CtsR family transcriptional regulator [Bacillota bacterium]MDH7495989.1 CtsR family transcriptional regulator [Bacillota bacterium]